MSYEQDQLEHFDASAASKDSPRSASVPETKGGSTEPTSTLDPTTPIISIRHRLTFIVNRELEKMERGEIDELSDQHNNMLHQLASLSVSSSASHLSESDSSNHVPTQPVPVYAGVLSAPKAATFTPNDVRSLTRLTGSADVDVAEVLSQFALLSVSRRKPLLRTTRNLQIILLLRTCLSSAMVLVSRCFNNLCQVGSTGVQTLSTTRTLILPVRLPPRPPGKSSN